MWNLRAIQDKSFTNINVRIFNASNLAEAYNQPANSHVELVGGHLDFQDEILLSPANGFSTGDWILQAKVWALEDGDEEEVEIVQFSIDN